VPVTLLLDFGMLAVVKYTNFMIGNLNGIFGTEIVTRLLFEYGRPDIAIRLLTAKEPHGFGRFMELGATTLWEYWGVARSHSHPMFGAVAAHLFDYVLGIRQTGGTVGYTDLVIEPRATEIVKRASGSIAAGGGKLSVSYQRENSRLSVRIAVPKGVKAEFCYDGRFYKLTEGDNTLTLDCAE
jgi:alpha-L-rhamnosidase